MALAEKIKVAELASRPHIIQPMILGNFLKQNDEWKATSGGARARDIVLRPVNIVRQLTP